MSASSMAANGAGPMPAISMMRYPASGPIGCLSCVGWVKRSADPTLVEFPKCCVCATLDTTYMFTRLGGQGIVGLVHATLGGGGNHAPHWVRDLLCCRFPCGWRVRAGRRQYCRACREQRRQPADAVGMVGGGGQAACLGCLPARVADLRERSAHTIHLDDVFAYVCCSSPRFACGNSPARVPPEGVGRSDRHDVEERNLELLGARLSLGQNGAVGALLSNIGSDARSPTPRLTATPRPGHPSIRPGQASTCWAT